MCYPSRMLPEPSAPTDRRTQVPRRWDVFQWFTLIMTVLGTTYAVGTRVQKVQDDIGSLETRVHSIERRLDLKS